MAEGNRAIIISENHAEGGLLARDLRSVIDDIQIVNDYEESYSRIREIRPDALFYFLTQNIERDIALIRQVTRHLPEIKVFIVAPKMDPKIILEGLRARISDYLIFPSSNGSLINSVREALGEREGKTGETIAVFSLKGGQGNSTICINIADHIQKLTGEKILLADFNFTRGDIGSTLNIESAYTGFDLVRDIDRMDKNLLFSSFHPHARKFYVLPVPEEISDADQINAKDMNRIISILSQNMDYTIIDMPHDLSQRSLAILDAADKILVIARQSVPSIKSAQRTLEFFQELNYSEEKVRIIVSCYSDREDLNSKDLSNVFKQPVFATITQDYNSVMQSENRSRPLDMVNGKSRINRDFEKLASLLTGIQAVYTAKKGLRSLLGSLLGK
ncbi:MAG: AAA family ATPase [Deltaproteobacteria bacterium]|nr:AAA family ATPase [Deltaproteobacteria bacterium]